MGIAKSSLSQSHPHSQLRLQRPRQRVQQKRDAEDDGGRPTTGQRFIDNYGAFWESESFCRYIKDSNCLGIIGGAMAEGANMAICYLNIQHDAYVGVITPNASAFKLYSQSTQPNVALISLYYLPTITQVSNQLIVS